MLSLRLGTKQGCPLSLSTQHCAVKSWHCKKASKRNKSYTDWKERKTVFTEAMIVYTGNSKQSTKKKKFPEVIGEFSKFVK